VLRSLQKEYDIYVTRMEQLMPQSIENDIFASSISKMVFRVVINRGNQERFGKACLRCMFGSSNGYTSWEHRFKEKVEDLLSMQKEGSQRV